jgi:sulfur carrier protein
MSNLIRVNGQKQELTAATVVELLRATGIDPSGRFLAVAINGAVVPRRDWMTARIGAGDDIEIVRPMSGG